MTRWALIIGGSSGIGLATAKKLGSEGYNLLLVHRDRRSFLPPFEKEVDLLRSAGSRVVAFNSDATRTDKIDEMIHEIPSQLTGDQIHVVVHAVARGNLKPLVGESNTLTESDLALTLQAMGTNVLSWVQRLLQANLLTDTASLITLTSQGSTRYWEGYGAVGMAKATLETLTRYLAIELAKRGIRANTVHAGITQTPALMAIPGADKLIKESTDNNPMGRMTRPEDVANAIYLLTLPEAAWITGATVHVDGGEHLI